MSDLFVVSTACDDSISVDNGSVCIDWYGSECTVCVANLSENLVGNICDSIDSVPKVSFSGVMFL